LLGIEHLIFREHKEEAMVMKFVLRKIDTDRSEFSICHTIGLTVVCLTVWV